MSTLDTPAPKTGGSPWRRPADRIFSGAATGSGILILAVLAGVALFLVIEAWPAITASAKDIPGGKGLADYIAPLAFGTVLAGALAIIVAVPLAVSVSLFITFFAPRRLAQPLGYAIDLLAAIPSV
ncbi:MAG: phosphate transport system permease protein, partial [Thermoleophilaceae bacterium]|nr:phosphate transport system permease protein [Thermoleophilaceae bacterium]